MKVRIIGHRVSTNFGVAGGTGIVTFENGVAEIAPDRFDAVARAVEAHGYKLEKAGERKQRRSKKAKGE